jgi:hypothetical protein
LHLLLLEAAVRLVMCQFQLESQLAGVAERCHSRPATRATQLLEALPLPLVQVPAVREAPSRWLLVPAAVVPVVMLRSSQAAQPAKVQEGQCLLSPAVVVHAAVPLRLQVAVARTHLALFQSRPGLGQLAVDQLP